MNQLSRKFWEAPSNIKNGYLKKEIIQSTNLEMKNMKGLTREFVYIPPSQAVGNHLIGAV